jgi:predicted enzyme related to lactoylglutathione lyase
MSRITGLGGAFFNITGDHEQLLEWYNKTLGLKVTEYGLNIASCKETLVTLKRSSNNAYINFTVDNLKEYMEELKNKGVIVVRELTNYDYGKFSQIKDLFGNIIELFEINPKEYEKMILRELESYKLKHK